MLVSMLHMGVKESGQEICLASGEWIPVPPPPPLFLLSVESQNVGRAGFKPVTLPHLLSAETVGVQPDFGLHL